MNGRILVGASLVALSFVGMEGGCKAKGSGIGGGGSGGTGGVVVTTSATNGSQANTGTGTQATTAQGLATTGQATTANNATGNTAATTTADAATTTAATTGNGMTTASSTTTTTTTNGTTTTAGSTSTASTGTGMCKPAPTLHPPMPGATNTLYCPFSGTPAVSCDAPSQHCCEPAMGTSACTASGTACGFTPGPNVGTDWGCQDPVADCASNSVCCSEMGASLITVTGCPQDTISKGMYHPSCMSGASCPTGTLQLCSDTSECPTGKVCKAFRHAGAEVGACQ